MKKTVISNLVLWAICSAAGTQWDGETYAAYSRLQSEHSRELFSQLDLERVESVLDVGCGNGLLASCIAQHMPAGYVVGLDPSASMLEQARLLQAELGLSNLHFVCGRIEDFVEGQFDLIVSTHALHWVEEREQAFSNLYRSLKPGGRLKFVAAPSKEGLPFQRALDKVVARYSSAFDCFDNNLRYLGVDEVRSQLMAAGFRVDELRLRFWETQHVNRQAFLLWLRQWLPHYDHLLPAQRDGFMDELVEQYLLEMGLSADHEGAFVWQEFVLFAEASRQ